MHDKGTDTSKSPVNWVTNKENERLASSRGAESSKHLQVHEGLQCSAHPILASDSLQYLGHRHITHMSVLQNLHVLDSHPESMQNVPT